MAKLAISSYYYVNEQAQSDQTKMSLVSVIRSQSVAIAY